MIARPSTTRARTTKSRLSPVIDGAGLVTTTDLCAECVDDTGTLVKQAANGATLPPQQGDMA